MDGHRSVGVDGRTIVPNSFRFGISEADDEQLARHPPAPCAASSPTRPASTPATRGTRFVGPVEVDRSRSTTGVRPGVLAVEGRFAEGEGGSAAGVAAAADRRPGAPRRVSSVSVGRQHDCTIVLADPNVSRHHAEVRPSGDGFVVVDLGSTNGTKVNGATDRRAPAADDGDEVRFGNTVMHFEAS